MYYVDHFQSPIGTIYLVAENGTLSNVFLTEDSFQDWETKVENAQAETPLTVEVKKQLDAYFNQKRKSFDLPITYKGTAFQMNVWKALRTIPFGETWSYLDVAKAIGNEKAVRAIGQANRRNPLPIIVPCHRVIGKNQRLVGYAGNHVDKKAYLLELEGAAYKL